MGIHHHTQSFRAHGYFTCICCALICEPEGMMEERGIHYFKDICEAHYLAPKYTYVYGHNCQFYEWQLKHQPLLCHRETREQAVIGMRHTLCEFRNEQIVIQNELHHLDEICCYSVVRAGLLSRLKGLQQKINHLEDLLRGGNQIIRL